MNDLIYATLAVTALVAFAPDANAAPRKLENAQPTARSAEAYAVQASFRGPQEGKGYSARARRVTDCLATYPGAYDPKTDRVRVGVQSRRCDL